MNDIERPSCIVIAGPNGAGKSTAAPVLFENYVGLPTYVNADTIARGLSAFDPEDVASEAGRVMLDWLRKLAASGKDFAFESTLSGRSYISLLRQFKVQYHYLVTIFYLWLPTVEQSRQRVEQRVRMGGHDIPLDALNRRHSRGLRNFLRDYSGVADRWVFFDSSRNEGLHPVAFKLQSDTIEIVDDIIWKQAHEQFDDQQ